MSVTVGPWHGKLSAFTLSEMSTSSAAQLTFPPECGCSCLTQQVCFPQHNGLKKRGRSITSSPQDSVRDLRRKNGQQAIQGRELLLLSEPSPWKGRDRQRPRAQAGGRWFPSQLCRCHPSSIIALLICQLLSAFPEGGSHLKAAGLWG